MMKKYQKWILAAILILQGFLLIYLKFTAWPEMSLWPYLIDKGWLPYRDIAIAHTPLMLGFLALFYKIAGSGIIQLKLFTWAVIFVLDFLVYRLVKKLWNAKVALFALGSFAFWQLFFDGNGLWFDLFMGIFAFVSFYFLQKKKYFWTGIFLGLAFISKQTAIWFLLPVVYEIFVAKKKKISAFVNLVKGGGLVSVIFILILLVFKILPDFYEWAIQFGIFILPRAQGQIQLPDLRGLSISLLPFVIFIPLFYQTKRKYLNLLFWSFAGLLGAYPRFEYFHFQPAIPYLAIALGIFFANLNWKNKIIKTFSILYIFGSIFLFGGFFMRNFNEGVRFYEQDVRGVVAYVKSNTNTTDKIFIMNWWDNVYALSDREPAVDPWVPQLSWYMELPGIQEKMINNLQENKPKLILINPYTETGLSAYIPREVYNYVTQNYFLRGKVDEIDIFILK